LNLEKSKSKIGLVGEAKAEAATRPSPILKEFTKSFNEMRKKVASQKNY
jgi:hypothetical protein